MNAPMTAQIGKGTAWIRLARLQFYPMVIIMYAVGVTAAYLSRGTLDRSIMLLGYACLFLIELAKCLPTKSATMKPTRTMATPACSPAVHA